MGMSLHPYAKRRIDIRTKPSVEACVTDGSGLGGFMQPFKSAIEIYSGALQLQ